MKRSYLDYRGWRCIREKSRIGSRVSVADFTGYVSLLHILAVDAPQIWHFNGEDIVICDAGRRWLTMLPEGGAYCITAMLDDENRPQLWYIDMIDAQGDDNGLPWFDDLYLDLVVYPDGTVLTDDRDELDDALRSGDITSAQHERALATERMLREGLLASVEGLAALTERCRKAVEGA